MHAALAELDAWNGDGFRRVHAALGRLHPAQDEFVFKGLQPGAGARSVVSVGTLLDRLDALESDPERKHTRKDDKAALETLTARGITSAERARLRGLVKTAESFEPTDPPDAALAASNAADSSHEADLRALRAWFDDWSETARAVIKRRDHLIRLGLAKRKKGEKAPAAPSADAAKSGAKPATAP